MAVQFIQADKSGSEMLEWSAVEYLWVLWVAREFRNTDLIREMSCSCHRLSCQVVLT